MIRYRLSSGASAFGNPVLSVNCCAGQSSVVVLSGNCAEPVVSGNCAEAVSGRIGQTGWTVSSSCVSVRGAQSHARLIPETGRQPAPLLSDRLYQPLAGHELRPAIRQQLLNPACRMRCDAHKDVSEVADDIDFGDAIALDQGVGDGGGAAASGTAGEEPVAAPDGDRADGSLASIVVDWDASVLQETA